MDGYLEVISLIERLHRQFLEVVKLELDGFGIRDINNVQAMMLFNIGVTVGELILRGCYLGSNVSYNLKKMVENGYLVQERSVHDRRSFHVRLTDKGVTCATGSASCTHGMSRCWARPRSPMLISKARLRRCVGSNGSGCGPAIFHSARGNSPPELAVPRQPPL
jgi:DNA-binding MarR family transcriptional regulator